jgi:hypothetical protein
LPPIYFPANFLPILAADPDPPINKKGHTDSTGMTLLLCVFV